MSLGFRVYNSEELLKSPNMMIIGLRVPTVVWLLIPCLQVVLFRGMGAGF